MDGIQIYIIKIYLQIILRALVGINDHFALRYYNLPGFCGVEEPEDGNFDIEKFTGGFAKWKKENVPNAKVLIGYSFGGAILLDYKARYKDSVPTMLVESINFGDEDPYGYLDLLVKIFGSDNTFVLDTVDNRRVLPVKAKYVSEEVFKKLLENRSKGYLVYHKAMATRQNNFDPSGYLNNRW